MIGEINHLHINHVLRDCSSFQKGKKKKKFHLGIYQILIDISYVKIIPIMNHNLILECTTVWRGRSICQTCILRVEFMLLKENHSNNLLLLQCLQLLTLFPPLQASNCMLKCSFPTIPLKYSLSVLHKMILKTNEDFAWAESEEGWIALKIGARRKNWTELRERLDVRF